MNPGSEPRRPSAQRREPLRQALARLGGHRVVVPVHAALQARRVDPALGGSVVDLQRGVSSIRQRPAASPKPMRPERQVSFATPAVNQAATLNRIAWWLGFMGSRRVRALPRFRV